ncbi:MAG: RNA polymerase sigma factor [Roseiflexaceae bacterium]
MGSIEMDDSDLATGGPPAPADELELVAALRRGDEAAFMALVERYQATMVRVALMYVADRATAEEVVQEAWLGVLRGLDRFQGRSTLRTWIFRILTNRAKTRGTRERRAVPFSALVDAGDDADEPAVDPARFYPPGHEDHGWWVSYPARWDGLPERRLLAEETRSQLAAAIAALPPNQRAVIALRDVEGWASEEVCNILAISETNQRVLLHRARSKVRSALEHYLTEA